MKAQYLMVFLLLENEEMNVKLWNFGKRKITLHTAKVWLSDRRRARMVAINFSFCKSCGLLVYNRTNKISVFFCGWINMKKSNQMRQKLFGPTFQSDIFVRNPMALNGLPAHFAYWNPDNLTHATYHKCRLYIEMHISNIMFHIFIHTNITNQRSHP